MYRIPVAERRRRLSEKTTVHRKTACESVSPDYGTKIIGVVRLKKFGKIHLI